jgi:hypothetical protein
VKSRLPFVAASHPNGGAAYRARKRFRFAVRGAVAVKRSLVADHVGVGIDLCHLRLIELRVEFDVAFDAGDLLDGRCLVAARAVRQLHNKLVAQVLLKKL